MTPGGVCSPVVAELEVRFPIVKEIFLSSNSRHHWAVERRAHRRWRELAGWRFRQAWRNQPPLGKVMVVVTFHFPDRRRRDPHNWVQHVLKPCVDGMVDAGVVADDDGAHLVGPLPLLGEVAPSPGCFVMRVEEVG